MEPVAAKIRFADEKVKEEFEKLKQSGDWLYKNVVRALEAVRNNVFAGIHVPKRLIPREYVQKYNATNLWKYDLAKGWRLLCTIKSEDATFVVAVILECMNHKDYEKRFGY